MSIAATKLEASYQGSFPDLRSCPKGNHPEYAFIGRSNVGKSSLINMLCDKKNLARTSNKPGKTQYLNYYLINNSWYLVDLPGYGYAKISKKKRLQWERMTDTYMQQRENLLCAFVLIDSNISPQSIDMEFMNKLGHFRIPFVIAYTKTDRIKPAKLEENIFVFQEEMRKYWTELPRQFVTSATTKAGKAEVIDFIQTTNQYYFDSL